MTDESATAVRPGAAISLRAVDAANAQDAAGLFLLPGADEFLLVGLDARLTDRFTGLETTGGFRSPRPRRTHGLGTLSRCGRRAPATCAAGCRRARLFGFTFRSRKREPGFFEHGRSGGH